MGAIGNYPEGGCGKSAPLVPASSVRAARAIRFVARSVAMSRSQFIRLTGGRDNETVTKDLKALIVSELLLKTPNGDYARNAACFRE